jgi:cysteine desulfuration protein SufE
MVFYPEEEDHKRESVMTATAREELQAIAEELSLFDDWEEKYAYIIDLGKRNARLSEEAKRDEYKVRGCISNVWLHADKGKDGVIFFRADSDAFIVRGLLTVLMRIYSGRKAEDVRSLPPDEVVETLGFGRYLSAGRHNGFRAVMERMRELAA